MFFLLFHCIFCDITYTESSDGSILYINGDGPVLYSKMSTLSIANYHEIQVEGDITGLNESAFRGCINAQKIILPKHMDYILNRAFANCESLKKITISEGIKTLPFLTFESCLKLKTIILPSTLQKVESLCFLDCDSIEEYIVSDSSEYFATNKNGSILTNKSGTIAILTKGFGQIIIPPNIEIFDIEMCRCFTKVTSISFEGISKLKSIKQGFIARTSISDIKFPSSLRKVFSKAFEESKIRTITFHGTLEFLASDAFYNAGKLESVKFIGNCDAVKVIGGVIYNREESEIIFVPPTIVTLNVTKNIRELSNTLITNSKQLEEVIVDSGNDKYCSYKGLLYESNLTILVACPYARDNATISKDCTEIADRAFFMTKIRKIVFDGTSVNKIGVESLNGITLTQFELPPNLAYINSYAFYGTNFGSNCLKFGPSFRSLEGSAFEKCETIEEVDLSESSCKKIKSRAFCDCIKLRIIKLPKNLEEIHELSFENCVFTLLEIPATVSWIGNRAFANVTIKTLSFKEPSSLGSIGVEAFTNTSIEEIELPSNIETLNTGSFQNCTQIRTISFERCTKLTTLSADAFESCSRLTEVSLPSTVNSLNPSAFSRCTSLININVSDLNTVYKSNEGVVFTENSKTLVIFPAGRTSYEVPRYTEKIGHKAFFHCSNLVNLTFEIGGSLQEIGNNTFTGCTSLSSLLIPASLSSLSSGAFSGCTALAFVSFEDGSLLKSLGSRALSGCTNLESVEFGENSSLTTIESGALEGCTKLSRFVFPASLRTIESRAFKGCCKITVQLTHGIETIGSECFARCSRITEVLLPSELTSLGERAFAMCDHLKKVMYCGSNDLTGTGNAFTGSKINSVLVGAQYRFGALGGVPTFPGLDGDCREPTKLFTAAPANGPCDHIFLSATFLGNGDGEGGH